VAPGGAAVGPRSIMSCLKSTKITRREIELARRWAKDGLLSAAGQSAVEKATGLQVLAK